MDFHFISQGWIKESRKSMKVVYRVRPYHEHVVYVTPTISVAGEGRVIERQSPV